MALRPFLRSANEIIELDVPDNSNFWEFVRIKEGSGSFRTISNPDDTNYSQFKKETYMLRNRTIRCGNYSLRIKYFINMDCIQDQEIERRIFDFYYPYILTFGERLYH